MIITIDGPSGSGKSSVAKRVAAKISFHYVDTGAMFRTLAWGLLENKIPLDKEANIASFIEQNPVQIISEDDIDHYFCGEKEATSFLRNLTVGQAASQISTFSSVRTAMLQLQRDIGEKQNSVFEGRDMGTVVFPHAKLKIFLTAQPSVRAHRRFLELQNKENIDLEKVLQQIEERDERDSLRALAPLRPAEDAIILDTSTLSLDQVVDKIIELYASVA